MKISRRDDLFPTTQIKLYSILFFLKVIHWWPTRNPLLFYHRTMGQNRKKKHRLNSHPIIHFPTRKGVSKVSERAKEWAQRRARAKRTVRSKWMSKRCERTSEWTTEWPNAQWVYSWIIRPTVQRNQTQSDTLVRDLEKDTRSQDSDDREGEVQGVGLGDRRSHDGGSREKKTRQKKQKRT